MPRKRIQKDRPLTTAERVARHRARRRRVELSFEQTEYDQLAQLAEGLGCSPRELLEATYGLLAGVCRQADSLEGLREATRHAFERVGLAAPGEVRPGETPRQVASPLRPQGPESTEHMATLYRENPDEAAVQLRTALTLRPGWALYLAHGMTRSVAEAGGNLPVLTGWYVDHFLG